MTEKLVVILIVAYLIIGITAMLEHKYPWALYWISAGLLNVAVLWGMK